jgi:drug/metabolite transporter (DMT)-like permease
MEQFNRQANNSGENAEAVVKTVTEELQRLHDNLIFTFQEDLKRLQGDKYRLQDEIRQLQAEKDQLQQVKEVTQQQALVRQLSQVLANHISSQLQDQMALLIHQAMEQRPVDDSNYSATDKVISSLDDSITLTLNSLKKELSNHQSHVSLQLSRMTAQQQEGEILLAELVNRLRMQLQETVREVSYQPPTTITHTHTNPTPTTPIATFTPSVSEEEISPKSDITQQDYWAISEDDSPIENELSDKPWKSPGYSLWDRNKESDLTEGKRQRNNRPWRLPVNLLSFFKLRDTGTQRTQRTQRTQSKTSLLSPTQMGLLFVVLSTVASALYYVVIKIIFNERSDILGAYQVNRLLLPTLGNSLLILMLRMLVAVPLMLILAPVMHRRVWQDIQKLIESFNDKSSSSSKANKRVVWLSALSGVFLFLSQILIYLALGQISTGMATTLFFVYPVVAGLLSWFLFRERPTTWTSVASAVICFGALLVLIGAATTGTSSLVGFIAVASGVAFAFYIIFSRVCAPKLHPVTFTVINFTSMLVLSFMGLIIPLPKSWSLQLQQSNLLGLFLSALILGVLTSVSYFLNNLGVRYYGATRSAIVGASIPALTVIFAGFMIQESLEVLQVLGVLLVTFAAAALGFEKIRKS